MSDPTTAQLNYLQKLGVSTVPKTKQEASDFIDEAKSELLSHDMDDDVFYGD